MQRSQLRFFGHRLLAYALGNQFIDGADQFVKMMRQFTNLAAPES